LVWACVLDEHRITDKQVMEFLNKKNKNLESLELENRLIDIEFTREG